MQNDIKLLPPIASSRRQLQQQVWNDTKLYRTTARLKLRKTNDLGQTSLISRSRRGQAKNVVKCYRCRRRRRSIQLSSISSVPFTKLEMFVLPHATLSVYSAWSNVRTTAAFCAVHELGDVRTAIRRTGGSYSIASTGFSRSTTPCALQGRIYSWVRGYVRQWSHRAWSLRHNITTSCLIRYADTVVD